MKKLSVLFLLLLLVFALASCRGESTTAGSSTTTAPLTAFDLHEAASKKSAAYAVSVDGTELGTLYLLGDAFAFEGKQISFYDFENKGYLVLQENAYLFDGTAYAPLRLACRGKISDFLMPNLIGAQLQQSGDVVTVSTADGGFLTYEQSALKNASYKVQGAEISLAPAHKIVRTDFSLAASSNDTAALLCALLELGDAVDVKGQLSAQSAGVSYTGNIIDGAFVNLKDKTAFLSFALSDGEKELTASLSCDATKIYGASEQATFSLSVQNVALLPSMLSAMLSGGSIEFPSTPNGDSASAMDVEMTLVGESMRLTLKNDDNGISVPVIISLTQENKIQTQATDATLKDVTLSFTTTLAPVSQTPSVTAPAPAVIHIDMDALWALSEGMQNVSQNAVHDFSGNLVLGLGKIPVIGNNIELSIGYRGQYGETSMALFLTVPYIASLTDAGMKELSPSALYIGKDTQSALFFENGMAYLQKTITVQYGLFSQTQTLTEKYALTEQAFYEQSDKWISFLLNFNEETFSTMGDLFGGNGTTGSGTGASAPPTTLPTGNKALTVSYQNATEISIYCDFTELFVLLEGSDASLDDTLKGGTLIASFEISENGLQIKEGRITLKSGVYFGISLSVVGAQQMDDTLFPQNYDDFSLVTE